VEQTVTVRVTTRKEVLFVNYSQQPSNIWWQYITLVATPRNGSFISTLWHDWKI